MWCCGCSLLLRSILTFPGCSSGNSSLLQGLESEVFLLITSSPSLTLPKPLWWQCCSQTAPGQLQMLRAALPRPHLGHVLVKREHLYCSAFARKVRLTPTAKPVLLQSLSVLLPLATSLHWQAGM